MTFTMANTLTPLSGAVGAATVDSLVPAYEASGRG